MRFFSVALLVLTGCSSSLSLEHVSTLTHGTKGVLLHADGQATAGIDGMVCTVQATGTVNEIGMIDDIDFTDAPETVEDSLGDTVIASSMVGLHFIESGVAGDSIDIEGVLAARLFSDGDTTGVAALRAVDGACQVEWLGAGSEAGAIASVSEALCGDVQVTADPATGAVYIANGDLHKVTPDAEVALGVSADFVRYDAQSGTLFAATDSRVTALVGDEVAWEREVDGTILSVGAYGDTGAAMVGLSKASGRGGLSIFGPERSGDGDGMPSFDEDLPEGGSVASSEDGSLLAVVLDRETHFFKVCREDCGSGMRFSPTGDETVRFID